ncbi:bifunctional dttp/utp pyrophosphatase/methyltransferase protein-related [Anaeramoeba flamelloides]|uniref:Bifunctional dttp/utp pyrophosphatase/methyltransferase protein-related n=1 Tax=Anaeramoeba flamelloides TaxID=1746091 RepID=A0AAV7YCF2_9EUKA|nr:bifunctional dttp/utp pyrophosphatase/methyltransferase protein-related [Anaeramoeba flamelloides]KAJ6229934.1 bifunctional dttp/utp pyrophosphatase/methyltransferase protein-related [Anaeramoeba flamelloides]
MFLTISGSLTKNWKIILGSSSPRRKDMMNQLGLNFRIVRSNFDESTLSTEDFATAGEFTEFSAKQKASDVLEQLKKECKENNTKLPDLIIGCDTVVVHENVEQIENMEGIGSRIGSTNSFIMGKPKGDLSAKKMLKYHSNRNHLVISGMALLYVQKNGEPTFATFHETTTLTFKKLTDEEIDHYVSSKEPMGKAGAYAIQGIGGCLIQKISGSYSK